MRDALLRHGLIPESANVTIHPPTRTESQPPGVYLTWLSHLLGEREVGGPELGHKSLGPSSALNAHFRHGGNPQLTCPEAGIGAVPSVKIVPGPGAREDRTGLHLCLPIPIPHPHSRDVSNGSVDCSELQWGNTLLGGIACRNEMQSLRACMSMRSFTAYSVRVPYFLSYVQSHISNYGEIVLIPSA